LKGVLLHGGHGTRLRPLTHTGPKQLIPVAGKPISQFCLEEMRAAGITEIAVILGSLAPEKVREYYGDGSRIGLKIHYIDQGEPRGLAHAVYLAKEFIQNDRFVVYLGDNLLKGGISEAAAEFALSDSDAMILLSEVKEPERFGVAKFDEQGKLEALIEKPKQPPSRFALVGVYFFAPVIFEAIAELKPSWRGELEITEAIQALLASGRKVQHKFVKGWWKDTGTVQDIIEANRLILDDRLHDSDIRGHVEEGAVVEGRVRLEEGARVEKNATVRGPASIGKNTVIGNGTYVAPYTSIGSSCEIMGCEVENSIIMDRCKIKAPLRIVDSLIGPETEISSMLTSKPKGYKLILGERSTIIL